MPDGLAQATGLTPWLRAVETARPPVVRLVCIAHAGAGASSFNSWPRHLPADVQIVKVQLPGREDHAACPPARRVDAVIEALAPLSECLLDRPLAIYGHSMGALVAFELARAMRHRRGVPPLALFVSGRRAPHKPLRHRFLHRLSDDDLVAHLRGMGGTAPELLDRARWRDRFLPIMRADLELSDVYQYEPEPPLECPLHAYLGHADQEMFREDWEAWSEQASGHFERHLLPGGHIFPAEARARLVTHIGASLQRYLEG